MPSYRNITINLQSDTAESIVEFAPPAAEASSGPASTSTRPPPLRDDKRATINVYIPYVPHTLFWVNYQVTPLPTDDSIFFVFKLLVNRRELSTWCCGYEQRFHGKCMFGLFDTTYRDNAGSEGSDAGHGTLSNALQKRILTFPSHPNEPYGSLRHGHDRDRFIEVRVCRANKIIRVQPRVQMYELGDQLVENIQLRNGGFLHSRAPQRYYKFGLIDPRDQPYARFRFHYRTWAEIDELNLRLGTVEGDDTSVFTADTTLLLQDGSENSFIHQVESNNSDRREPSARSSISQEYFARYPTPEVPPKDAPGLAINATSQITDERALVSPVSDMKRALTNLPQSSKPPLLALQGSSCPPLPPPRSYEAYNPYQAWNFYQGNAFAQPYNLQCQQPTNVGLISPTYALLPPGHPHSLLPRPVIENGKQQRPSSVSTYIPRPLDTTRPLPPLPQPSLPQSIAIPPGRTTPPPDTTYSLPAASELRQSSQSPHGSHRKERDSKRGSVRSMGGVMNRISHAFKRT